VTNDNAMMIHHIIKTIIENGFNSRPSIWCCAVSLCWLESAYSQPTFCCRRFGPVK